MSDKLEKVKMRLAAASGLAFEKREVRAPAEELIGKGRKVFVDAMGLHAFKKTSRRSPHLPWTKHLWTKKPSLKQQKAAKSLRAEVARRMQEREARLEQQMRDIRALLSK